MNNGKLSKDNAQALWKLIEPFAAYGFNKAHAASYGKVAYQTAYMKAHYPVEYMAAVLTADSGNVEQIATMVAECERLKVPVLPPDLNESGTMFTVAGENKDTIRFGLSTIKNFGEGISEAIIAEREKGPFTSLSDFLCRIGSKNLNRKALESLIKCGAMDRFGERVHLFAHIETLLAFYRDAATAPAQDALFASAAPELKLPESDKQTPLKDKLMWEKELLGIYVSGHPLDSHKATLEKAKLTIARIKEEPQNGLPVIIPALVAEVRTVLTKSGEKMSFVRFEDKTDSIEAVVFPKLYKEQSSALVEGSCVLLKAKISIRNGETTLAIDNLKPL